MTGSISANYREQLEARRKFYAAQNADELKLRAEQRNSEKYWKSLTQAQPEKWPRVCRFAAQVGLGLADKRVRTNTNLVERRLVKPGLFKAEFVQTTPTHRGWQVLWIASKRPISDGDTKSPSPGITVTEGIMLTTKGQLGRYIMSTTTAVIRDTDTFVEHGPSKPPLDLRPSISGATIDQRRAVEVATYADTIIHNLIDLAARYDVRADIGILE